MRKHSRIWAVLGLLILTICLWGCGDKAGTTTEKKEGANSLSKSDYGKYMDAYLDYANAHENDHAGYDCGYAMTLDAADYPVLVMIYLKADQNSSDDDYYDEYDSDYSDERSEAGSPYMYWDFLGYKNGEVERIEELTASEDERVIINCDGIVAKRKDSSEGQIYLIKKGKWQELYSYAIDGSQGVALAYINSKDGKQTVKFQDEDGNLTTANDYEKEIKKLFRTIYGKNEYYTEVIQNMTLYELLADDTVAVSPVLYAEKKDAFDDYNEAAIVYSKMQFQTIISDMKEQWIHTQDGLYSYLVDDRYRMVKPDRFYEFDCKGLLRRDLNWIKDTKFVEEADGGFFCEWLSDWASDYLDNEYINDDTYKIFSDMEDNAWIGNKLGMGDKTGEADQDDTDTETNDDEIVLTVDEKKEMLSSFVQWFYSEERHSKLAAWNDLTGASSPLIGYWQGEHIGMAVINYTDIKYGGLYFYILNTLEDGRMGYTKIYEGNAEKIRLNNHMDLKLEDDTHITLSYKLRNGDVKIAIENCPMLFGEEQWPGGQNLMTTPPIWREVFKILDSDNLGINYDPSHFIWQMIDYIRPLYEFKDKIFHVHYKDIKIYRDKLESCGIMAYPLEYMSPKIPGLGDVDWGKYVSALTDIGYDGCTCIEIEDKAFEDSKEKVEKSLILSKRYLEKYVI